MFVVRRFICSLVSVANVFAFVACDRSSSTPSYGLSLSKREAQAVDRFKRDRWTDVIDVYRLGPNTLRVRTQQGNESIDYRVTLPAEGEAEFVRMPIVTFGS